MTIAVIDMFFALILIPGYIISTYRRWKRFEFFYGWFWGGFSLIARIYFIMEYTFSLYLERTRIDHLFSLESIFMILSSFPYVLAKVFISGSPFTIDFDHAMYRLCEMLVVLKITKF